MHIQPSRPSSHLFRKDCFPIDFDQVNIEHQMLGREGNVVEGKDHDSGDSSAGSITKEDRVLDDKKVADLA